MKLINHLFLKPQWEDKTNNNYVVYYLDFKNEINPITDSFTSENFFNTFRDVENQTLHLFFEHQFDFAENIETFTDKIELLRPHNVFVHFLHQRIYIDCVNGVLEEDFLQIKKYYKLNQEDVLLHFENIHVLSKLIWRIIDWIPSPDDPKMVHLFDKELIENKGLNGKISFCGQDAEKLDVYKKAFPESYESELDDFKEDVPLSMYGEFKDYQNYQSSILERVKEYQNGIESLEKIK